MSTPRDDLRRDVASGNSPRRLQAVLAVLLLFVGVELSLLIGGGQWPPNRRIIIVMVIAAAGSLPALLPGVRDRTEALLERLRRPGARARGVLGGAILLGSIAYLYFTAVHQHRTFSLKYQDEFSYAIQTQMLARGHLWMPAHPLSEFFESFQIVVTPVYASIYFPGAAMMYAPGVWLSLPPWVIPLTLCGVAITLWYLIVSELMDSMVGVVAAAMMISLPILRLQSIMVMAQIPVLVLGLGMIWSWLRWRASHGRLPWTAAIGLLIGLACITRPVDALCFAVPVLAAMAIQLSCGADRKAWIGQILLLAAAAAPFLCVQLVFNRSVTGSFFKTPFTFYAEQFYPGTEYGFGHAATSPQTSLPQKLAYYETEVRPRVLEHHPAPAAKNWLKKNLPTTLLNGLPHALLVALLPVGILALRRRTPALVVVAPLLLFPLLYWPYAFFLTHYTLTAAPAVLMLALLGVDAMQSVAGRWRTAAGIFLTLSIFLISIVELPEFNRLNADEFFPATALWGVDQQLAAEVPPDQRAIVLFRFAAGCNPQEEPVYNPTVAWPDDARIIRAHDLGEKNIRLFRYYASRQPDRVVYVYDRGTGTLAPLGKVADRAADPIISR